MYRQSYLKNQRNSMRTTALRQMSTGNQSSSTGINKGLAITLALVAVGAAYINHSNNSSSSKL